MVDDRAALFDIQSYFESQTWRNDGYTVERENYGKTLWAIPALRKLYRLCQTLSGNLNAHAYHRISSLSISRCKVTYCMRSAESAVFPPSTPLLTSSFFLFTSMQPPTTDTSEKTTERRQLRDIKGNLVYRDKDDTRVFLSHIAEYTFWNNCCFYLTYPLFYRRCSRPYDWIHTSIWTSPDPTIVVPSGRRYPEYWPKYEDEPRPEPE